MHADLYLEMRFMENFSNNMIAAEECRLRHDMDGYRKHAAQARIFNTCAQLVQQVGRKELYEYAIQAVEDKSAWPVNDERETFTQVIRLIEAVPNVKIDRKDGYVLECDSCHAQWDQPVNRDAVPYDPLKFVVCPQCGHDQWTATGIINEATQQEEE